MPLKRRELLAYLSGLFDGEGSVGAPISPHSRENYRVTVSVGMCDVEGVDLFAIVFGGRVRKQKRLTATGKPVYVWSLHCQNAATALEQMLPYLRIKRARAENAILLARLMDRRNATAVRDGGQIVNLERRRELAGLITQANFSSNGRIRRASEKRVITGSSVG